MLLEQAQKFLENLALSGEQLLEAKADKGKSQTLEPRRRKHSMVNQGANTKQLTLFDFG